VNAIYQALTVWMICQLGALLVPAYEARAMSWVLLLMPMSFTYRVRANQEQLILLLFLSALYAIERSRRRAWWGAIVAIVASLALLVKGVFVVPLLVSCAVWLLVRSARITRERSAWLGLAAAAATVLLVALAYEYSYQAVTGESFFGFYLLQQLQVAQPTRGAFVRQKVVNLIWYLSRLLWFAFPWSLVLAGAAAVGRRLPADYTSKRALMAALASASVWPLMLSLPNRHADRYIFPAYFLIGGAGFVVAFRRSTRFQAVVAWVVRAYPYEQVAVWLLLTLLSLLATLGGLPRIR
jgi:4-amino-4-deoxy-L-arabinose transferase-like glycosyltransferase